MVEALVVIGIIGVLLGLIIPAIQRAREAAAHAQCLSNLKQIALALHHHHGDHGRFPPLPNNSINMNRPTLFEDRLRVWLSWMGQILPYIEQDALWASTQTAFQVEEYPWVNPPHVGLATVIRLYVCPDDPRLLTTHDDPNGLTGAFTSYLGVGGGRSGDGVLGYLIIPGVSLANITDGASNTLMVGERAPPDTFQAGWWYTGGGRTYWLRGPDTGWMMAAPWLRDEPCQGPFHYGPGRTDNPCDRFHFWSLHPGGANFAFADGSVRFLPYGAEPIMVALATRAGGEVVDLSEFD
jgi:prepilin-type processing-associated H-X9-DG protein